MSVHQHAQRRHAAGTGGSPSASPAEQQAIAAALTANPDIAHWVPETGATVGVAGLSQQAQVTAFDGDASWTGYPIIKGSWYSGSGSVDVNTTFLTDTGTSVGSTVTLTSGGRSETVRIAGEASANDTSDPGVFMSGSDLARIDPGQAPTQYYAGIKPGLLVAVRLLALAGLVIAVVAALGPAGWAARTRTAFALRAE